MNLARRGFTYLLPLLLFAGQSTADIDAAQKMHADYTKAMRAVEDSVAQNDLESAAQESQQARAHAAKALDLFKAANVLEIGGPQALEAYAEILAGQGDHDLAAQAIEAALAQSPGAPRLWRQYGDYLGTLGASRRKDAFDSLQKSLDLDNSSPEAARCYYRLGDLYHRESLPEFAEEAYTAALKLDPEHTLARIGLAALDARKGNILEASNAIDALGPGARQYDVQTRVLLRKALADFDAARRVFPDTAENHAAYARLLYRAARFANALAALGRATFLAPDDHQSWTFLGQIQNQLGNQEAALNAFEKSLEINPDQPGLRQSVENFRAQGPDPQPEQADAL